MPKGRELVENFPYLPNLCFGAKSFLGDHGVKNTSEMILVSLIKGFHWFLIAH